MTVILDTNIVIRHLTQEPADQGQAATLLLKQTSDLVLLDVIAAEIVYVLESVYKMPREAVATALRALLSMRSVSAERGQVVKRSLDLYELERMHYTDAYLVAAAEAVGATQVASFDKGIDKPVTRASNVRRLDPLATP